MSDAPATVLRRYMILCERVLDATTYWTPEQITHFAGYGRNMIFKTEADARAWVYHKLEYWDQQSWVQSFGGPTGPEINRQIADLVPLYMSGKSFKIGKRIRTTKKPWDGVEIIRPSLAGLMELGWINPFDGYDVIGVKMVPVRLLRMTEDHSNTESGQEKMYRYAARIKDDETFLAIIVDTHNTILDGHHRYRAVRDVLKWKMIPALVVRIGEDE